MPELEQAPIATEAPKEVSGRFFNRFTREQRYLHAVLFSTFLGLAGTGLPLRFSESIWARGLAGAVGGFGAILFFHKFCALVLTIAFLHSREGSLYPWSSSSRKGNLLGCYFDGGQLERCERHVQPYALDARPRPQAAV